MAKMSDDQLRAKLASLDGTDRDATKIVQEAFDRGFSGIPGTYRVRFPVVIGGLRYSPGTVERPQQRNRRRRWADVHPGEIDTDKEVRWDASKSPMLDRLLTVNLLPYDD